MRFFYLSENLFTHKPIVRVITNDRTNKEFAKCETIPTVAQALSNLYAIGVENAVSYDTLLDEITNIVKAGVDNE